TTSEIGTLSAAQGALNLKENTLITLGAGAANAQKVHSLGGISTGTGAGLVLGDYATLQINDIPSALKDDYGTVGNTDSASSLQLAIGGGTGSVLELALSARATDNTDWKRNNTVTLSTPTGAASGVGEVRVSSGSLANAVFSGPATTNLNGAALRMADGTSIILRKANSSENLGAGDITLEGTTELFNYNITGTLTNNISGNKLNITNEGNVTLTGNVNLQALQMGINTTLGDGVNERTYTLGAVTATSATTLTVSKNATLNHLSSVTGAVTLAGSGVYDLGSGTIANVSGLTAATWTGTVKKHSDGDIGQLNTYANADSTLDLSGVKAWISDNQTFNGTLQLTNNGDTSALSLNNGYSDNAKATFAGTIKGSGDISYIWSGGTEGITAEHTFSAATDEWGGKFVAKSTNKNVSLSFTKAGNVFDGDSERAGVENASAYKLTVNVGSSAENGDITFDGTIGKTGNGAVELNVTNNKVTFNKTVNVDKLTVAQGASAQLGNTMTVGGVTFTATDHATAESPAKLTGAGDNALVAMQSATSFSISDMTLSNVKLSAVEGASVALTNVSGTAELAGAGNYTLGMVGAMENDNGGTALTLKYTSDLAITMSGTGSRLLLSADPTADVNGIFGTYNLTLTLNYTLAGDLASAETVNWQELVGFTGVLGDLLTAQTAEATVDLAEGEAAVAAAGTAPTVEYNYTAPGEGAQVGMLVITINGLNVPEPATSTLSLLALAALAARRRRK
ncbi:MAG: PEP-CTERM sorting domain-containing protein, partial [Akkermansia sp.]|nr:PEP-CTERM sorting domain-containing protein [Akkermansia sp.]